MNDDNGSVLVAFLCLDVRAYCLYIINVYELQILTNAAVIRACSERRVQLV